METDEKLVKDFQERGDRKALDELADRYVSKIPEIVKKLGYRLSWHDIEDLSIDVWIRLIKSIDKYEGRCSFSTWIHTIAKNLTFDLLRSSQRSPVFLLPKNEVGNNPASSLPNGDQIIVSKEFADILTDTMVLCLTAREYDVYGLRLMGWRNIEIADLLNTSQSAIGAHLHNAREEVKNSIKNNYSYSEQEIETEIRKTQKACMDYLMEMLDTKHPAKGGFMRWLK